MKNLDTPAFPDSEGQIDYTGGLTKRERACIDLRIPESGDAELDALIEKARRQEMVGKVLQGYLSNAWQAETLDSLGDTSTQQMATVAEISSLMADAMIAELERTDG